MPGSRKNIVVKKVFVTELSQQLRRDRNFLRWMARKYDDSNVDQAQAFRTAAEILERTREKLLAGEYDVGGRKELFTKQASRRPKDQDDD